MKIDMTNWNEFKLKDLFSFQNCKCSNASNLAEGNEIFYIGAKKSDNGVMKKVAFDKSLVTKGNCIIFICDGQGSVGYSNYIEQDFIGSTTLTVGYNKYLNRNVGLFLVTVFDLQRSKYSFGRKYRKHLGDTIIKLPSKDGKPDYDYMENYIKSLYHKPISTGITRNKISLDTTIWKEFKLSEIFTVKYGVNLELLNCDITNSDDDDCVNFVARTSVNNGIVAKVKKIPNITPQSAGTITCAGGGSVLSTFLQTKDFYSGRDLYLLIPKYEMSLYSKLFCITVIRANRYRFNYGRQANKSLPNLIIKLPADKNGTPNFEFMEKYMKSLPYSDKIEIKK
nr:restriction endonuclease subunit S [Clostridium paraputrificum]